MASKRHKQLRERPLVSDHKRIFTVRVDENVLEGFRKKILDSYGTGYGKTSACVEEALADWTNKKVKA